MTSPAIIQKELLDAKAVLVGSGNYNNAMAGSIAAFLEKLITCKVKNKKGLGFGSYAGQILSQRKSMPAWERQESHC